MTWTYSSSSLGLIKNKVRLLVGDNDTTRQQLEDEEITYVTDLETSPTLAAATCCDLLAAKYSFQMNTELGNLRISAAARMKHYLDLADRLRRGGAGSIPGDSTVIAADMYVGGTSQAAKDALADDSDNVGVFARLGMDDYDQSASTEDLWDPVD